MAYDQKDPQALLRQLTAHKDRDAADYAARLAEFVATGEPACVTRVTAAPLQADVESLGRAVGASAWPWSEECRRIAEFGARLYLAHPARGWPCFHDLWDGVLRGAFEREWNGAPGAAEWLLERVRELGFSAEDIYHGTDRGSRRCAFAAWGSEPDTDRATCWERHILELPSSELTPLLGGDDVSLLRALCAVRVELVKEWFQLRYPPQGKARPTDDEVRALIAHTDEFDSVATAFVQSAADSLERGIVLEDLMKRRPERHRDFFLSAAREPSVAACPEILARLSTVAPQLALEVLPAVIRGAFLALYGVTAGPEYRQAYALAAEHLNGAGRSVVDALVETSDAAGKATAVAVLLDRAGASPGAETMDAVRRILRSIAVIEVKAPAYRKTAEHHAAWLEEEWREYLGSSSKQMREVAVEALAKQATEKARVIAAEGLRGKRSDLRLGAAALSATMSDPALAPALLEALAGEKSAPVKAEIRRALEKCGGTVPAGSISGAAGDASSNDLLALASHLAAQKRPPKPIADWVRLSGMPGLVTREGRPLGETLVSYLLGLQAAHKPVGISPEVAPLLAQIDRSSSGDFALALLNAWLGSAQDAKHRWAMAIAGALGDTRILSVLNSWIPKWCEVGRGKLAEYAAQALALQGSDEALMLLDALGTRYRNKQRNIGAAAAQAFQAAADARGLSSDELGDRVVPTFGFDEDGLREFAWEGGEARAELGVDLKLSWSDPESDKSPKGLPASAPDALKAEVKELGKLLREAAKSQTARLELALVRQRRWPAARWRELYERHPVLRAFATRLVWGVYGADGATLLRCFRRYPNGLLADAAGDLEELPEADAQIGLVHPLELSPEAIAAWQGHLSRFKVAPPFPQLERAVERLDPLHANRRELAVAQGKELGAGTFRSRAERRGWQRGSVVDAGGVAGYFKAFPGAGVEVALETEGLYIGIDPMDTIKLGVARFVRADTVRRGGYVYDDPQAGDERVLNFGSVPSVVYSEAVGDLKAIAGIVAAPEPTEESADA